MSKFLLEALMSCKNQDEITQICDIAKNTKKTNMSVNQAIHKSKEKGFKVGKRVILNHDPDKEVGEVVDFNTSTIGFYTGDRYPIIVKFERGTFEYNPDNLTLI